MSQISALRSAVAERAKQTVLHLDPTLPRLDSRFHSAVLLIMAHEVGPNVDRLARLSGYPRESVAKRARRLVDHGVWVAGIPGLSLLADPHGGPEFWRDVDVAEGLAWRHSLDAGGYEWGEVGAWGRQGRPLDPVPDPTHCERDDEEPAHAGDLASQITAEASPGAPASETQPATAKGMDWDAIGRSILTDWDEKRDFYLPQLIALAVADSGQSRDAA